MKNPFKTCIPWRHSRKQKKRKHTNNDIKFQFEPSQQTVKTYDGEGKSALCVNEHKFNECGNRSSIWNEIDKGDVIHDHFNECSIWNETGKVTSPLKGLIYDRANKQALEVQPLIEEKMELDQCESDRLLKHDASLQHDPNTEKYVLLNDTPLSYLDEQLNSDPLYDKEKNVDTRKERLDDEEDQCESDQLLKHDASGQHDPNTEKYVLLNDTPLSYLDGQLNSNPLYDKEKNVDTTKERLDDEEDNLPKHCKCSMHTDYIRQQTYKSLLDLVPAFQQEFQIALMVDICYRPPKCDIPLFLVETAAFTGKLEWRGIEVFCFQHNVPASSEGKDVFAREGTLPNKEAIEVSKVIQETQEDYAKIHSNIEIISASRFKSKSFGKNWTLEDTNCIVLYCRRKGFIPFLEEAFPTNIKGIPVDVREGMVETAAAATTLPECEGYGNVRSGIAISAYGSDKSGTLGPIFDHPTYKYPCALTNAHVALSDNRMWSLLQNIPTISDNDPDFVMNPPGPSYLNGNTDERIFGHVQKSAITKGGGFEAGADVAVVQITSRFPDSGCFPSDTEESLNQIGYSSNYPPLYQGEMQKNVQLWRFHDVIKFGAATGWTRGVPCLAPIFTRRRDIVAQDPQGQLVYTLCNQIEIKSLQGSDFAKIGDSGSTIFYRREEDNQLVAVGLLNAVTTYGSTFVSPIADCLKAVGLESLSHFKKFPGRTRTPNLTRNTNVSAVGHLATRKLTHLYINALFQVKKEPHIVTGNRKFTLMQKSRKCLGSLLPNHQQTKVCRSNLAGAESGYGEHSVRSSSEISFIERERFSSNPQEQNQNIIPNRCSTDSGLHKPVEKCYPNPTNTESSGITDKATHDTLGAEGGVSRLHSTSHSLLLGLSDSTESIPFVTSDENKK